MVPLISKIIIYIRQKCFIVLLNHPKFVKNDKLYVFLFYFLGTGRMLNFKSPKRYSEKLQLLKIKVNVSPVLGDFVDKLKSRRIVAELIGEKYLNEIYAIFDNSKEIDFDSFKYPCVIKTTHDSGTVFVLKSNPNFQTRHEIKKILDIKLAQNYFWKGRETPYKYAEAKIICEFFLHEPNYDSPIDYKVYCFNGEIKILQVSLVKDNRKYVNYYDENKNPIEIRSGGYDINKKFVLPSAIDEIYKVSKILSKGFCHIRVDFYYIDGKVLFGEFTFHSDGGLLNFENDNWDFIMGSYIKCF